MPPSTRFTFAELQAMLNSFGIPSGYFTDLLEQAVTERWTPEMLTANIYSSQEFRTMFPGYFRPDGTAMFSSAAQYLQQRDLYYHAADLYGENISGDVIAQQFEMGRSPQEFADVLSAVQRIKEDPQYWSQFQRFAADAGLGDVTKGDLVSFALGEKPAEWYDLMEKTSLAGEAAAQGLKLSDKNIKQLQSRLPGSAAQGLDATQLASSFEEVVRNLRDMDLAKLYGFGLTKADVIAAQFGGQGSEKARRKIEQLHATDEAFQREVRGHTQVAQTQGGGFATIGGQAERAQVQ